MYRLRWIGILWLAALIWLWTVPVEAQTETGDRVIFGQSYTLPSGHRLKGDLAVFGGTVTLEEDSEVDGDIMVAGGNLSVAGRVEGDIAVFGGNLSLRDTAYVDGDIAVFGGNVDRAEGAIVTGEVITGFRWERAWPLFRGPISVPEISEMSSVSGADLLVRIFLRILTAFLLAALMALLAVIVLALAPEATARVGEAVQTSPGLSMIIGLMTLVLALGMAFVLTITICFLPVAFLLMVVLILTLLYGWIALGWLLGDRLLRTLNVEEPQPVLSGVIGVPLITLVTRLPCLGSILFLLGASLGLGAVVLTRAGRQRLPVAAEPEPATER